MITIIISVLGIISTLLAWFLNPRRRLYAELDAIYKKLEELYAARDKALISNDSVILTLVNADITKLLTRKAILFQRR